MIMAEDKKSAPKRKPPRKKKEEKAPEPAKAAASEEKKAPAPGKGIVRFNKVDVRSLQNKYVRDTITEAIRYLGPEANSIDILVNVEGGGTMGQAQAARTAIANALCGYFEDMKLKDKFAEIDRSLVVEDTRRVESKKYRGPKARARFQKSYR